MLGPPTYLTQLTPERHVGVRQGRWPCSQQQTSAPRLRSRGAALQAATARQPSPFEGQLQLLLLLLTSYYPCCYLPPKPLDMPKPQAPHNDSTPWYATFRPARLIQCVYLTYQKTAPGTHLAPQSAHPPDLQWAARSLTCRPHAQLAKCSCARASIRPCPAKPRPRPKYGSNAAAAACLHSRS